MHITALWHPGLRIIGFGARSGALGDALVRGGYLHFLAVVGDRPELEKLTQEHPRLQARATVARQSLAVRKNNAEVLVLDGATVWHLARFRSVRHASWVALPLVPSPGLLLGVLFGLAQCLLRRFSRPTVVSVKRADGRSLRLVAFGNRRRHTGSTRRYIPHALGVERFLKRLRGQRLKHAVLRWFDELPKLPPGEDLDLLVDDASLDAVCAMLDEGPGLQPIDVYSTTGLPGADFYKMPYFPPPVAEGILDRACLHRELCFVPAAEDHFLSLAYHALYHKGAKSGLPAASENASTARRPEHDYAGILERMARQLKVDVPITLVDLDRLLDERRWRPPHDMLVRLSRRNSWLGSLLSAAHQEDGDAGLAVFLLREAALERGGTGRAVELIERHGFHVLHTQILTERLSQSVAPCLRGGNWGRGPWPKSGGPPAAVIVAYDLQPIAPSRRERKKFPYLANARLLCKTKIRDAFNESLPAAEHCNVVHSSDNGREALDYLRAVLPEGVEAILAQAARLLHPDRAGDSATTEFRPRIEIERRAA